MRAKKPIQTVYDPLHVPSSHPSGERGFSWRAFFSGFQYHFPLAWAKFLLAMELILLFGGLPVLVWLTRPHAMSWLPVLYSIPALALWWLASRPGFQWSQLWYADDPQAERRQFKIVLYRFGIAVPVVFIFVATIYPHLLFRFPCERTGVWLAIFFVYPLFSAYPQELIYRAFFRKRYQILFSRSWLFILMSTLVFSWMHVIFRNPLAVAFTLIGGFFFSQTYARTRSMRLVCLEHALYGNFMFTIGIGEFFHHSRISAGL